MAKNYISLILLFWSIIPCFAQDVASISLNILNNHSDSLNCTLSVNPITQDKEEILIKQTNGSFSGEIPVSNYLFISISDGKNLIEGLVEPGDNIAINYDANNFDNTLAFAGKGSRKFSICFDYKRAFKVTLADRLNNYPKGFASVEDFYNKIDSIETSLFKKLNDNTFNISSSSFNILKGEIKGLALLNRYYGVEKLLDAHILKSEALSSADLSSKTLSTIKGITDFNSSYYLSPQYVKAVCYVMSAEYHALLNEGKIDKGIEARYGFIDSKLKDQLKIPVRSMFLLADMEESLDQDGIHDMIVKTFENHPISEFKLLLENEYVNYRVGKKAPDFTLEDFDGKKVTLEDLKGKVIYVNFWFSGNSACHNLFTKLRVVKDHFKDNPNVVFLTISVDSKELWVRTLTSYKTQGYHCYTEGKGLDHPIISSYKVNKFPTTFVIDKNGNFLMTKVPDQPLELISVLESAAVEPLVVETTETSKVSKRR